MRSSFSFARFHLALDLALDRRHHVLETHFAIDADLVAAHVARDQRLAELVEARRHCVHRFVVEPDLPLGRASACPAGAAGDVGFAAQLFVAPLHALERRAATVERPA